MTESVVIDKRAMRNDLVDAFIDYQYSLEDPFGATQATKQQKLEAYLNDYMFHNKVDRLVAGVMLIVSEHIDK